MSATNTEQHHIPSARELMELAAEIGTLAEGIAWSADGCRRMPEVAARTAKSLTDARDFLVEARRFHVETGDCLLAGPEHGCACGLRRPDGTEDEDGIRAAQMRLEMENDKCQPNDHA